MKKYRPIFSAGLKCLLTVTLLFIVTSATQAQNKETLVNKVPKHLPIKVEILYGEKAEVLENAEIKVTNTGKRPIYFLNFQISTAENSGLGMIYGVTSFYFGRTELITFGNLAKSDDPALQPRESLLFEVGKKNVEGFRQARQAAEQIIPERYELIFQFLSFGDDTGYSGTTAKPFSFKKERPFKNATDRISFFFSAAN